MRETFPMSLVFCEEDVKFDFPDVKSVIINKLRRYSSICGLNRDHRGNIAAEWLHILGV